MQACPVDCSVHIYMRLLSHLRAQQFSRTQCLNTPAQQFSRTQCLNTPFPEGIQFRLTLLQFQLDTRLAACQIIARCLSRAGRLDPARQRQFLLALN